MRTINSRKPPGKHADHGDPDPGRCCAVDVGPGHDLPDWPSRIGAAVLPVTAPTAFAPR